MVAQDVRTRIWTSLIEAQVRCVYFDDIAVRLQSRERLAAFLVGVFSSVAFINLVSKFQVPEISMGFSFLSAVAGIYLGLARQGKAASLASSIGRTWGEVQDDYEVLWLQLGGIDNDVALDRWRAIEAKHYNADESSSAISRNRKRVRQCQLRVFKLRGLPIDEST